MINNKKIYKHHTIINRENALKEATQSEQTTERKYMAKCIQSVIRYLDYVQILDYHDFISPFKSIGLDSKKIKELFLEFKLSLSEKTIGWLTKRNIIKANMTELNLIINRLMFQYTNEIIEYLQKNLHNYCSEITEKNIIIHDIQTKIRGKIKGTRNPILNNYLDVALNPSNIISEEKYKHI